ncbi:transcriptional regulator [Brochothrix thermosphacta]|nr:transcriptional regulator [Brochothrix thermosphacta]
MMEKHEHALECMSESKKDAIQKRLRRVEGQARGIQKMVEEDRYCIDIITQISAANAALKKVSLELLEHHMEHCMAKAVKDGNVEGMSADIMKVVNQINRI